MTFLATCLADIFRGSTTNGPGDEIDANDAEHRIAASVPASLIEVNKRIQDPSTGTWRTVRMAKGRLTFGADIAPGDRIKDLTTSTIYYVDEVNRTPRTIAGQAQLLLDLSITGNTAP